MQEPIKRYESIFLRDYLEYVNIHDMNVYSLRDEIVSISGNTGSEPEKVLKQFKTTDNFFCYDFRRAKQLINFPDIVRIARCPDVTLLCKGGVLVAKEYTEDKGSAFTPFRLILLWNVAFTGESFRRQGVQMHQWKCFSWGIPQEKDIIELDRWNIPGELRKHNDEQKQVAKSIVEWMRHCVEHKSA